MNETVVVGRRGLGVVCDDGDGAAELEVGLGSVRSQNDFTAEPSSLSSQNDDRAALIRDVPKIIPTRMLSMMKPVKMPTSRPFVNGFILGTELSAAAHDKQLVCKGKSEMLFIQDLFTFQSSEWSEKTIVVN